MSAHSVLYITASVGLALGIGLTAAGAGIYDAVVEHDGISGLDQPALDQCIAYRTSTNTQLLTAVTTSHRLFLTIRRAKPSGGVGEVVNG